MNDRKTLYARYYEAFCTRNGIDHSGTIDVKELPLTGVEFLRMPYHERLRLAGIKIEIVAAPAISCSQLRHLPVNTILPLPELPKETFTEFRRDDVYLLGEDKEAYPIYPWEYTIVW